MHYLDLSEADSFLILLRLHLLEDVFRVQDLLVNDVWGQIALTHHEDLGGLGARGLGFGGVHLLEELPHHPH